MMVPFPVPFQNIWDSISFHFNVVGGEMKRRGNGIILSDEGRMNYDPAKLWFLFI